MEISLRWLAHHSELSENDGVILGVSKIGHLENNIEMIRKGSLSNDIVELLNESWKMVESKCPKYFR